MAFSRDDSVMFTVGQIAQQRGLSLPSARVFCSRKVKSGKLLRLRRDLYTLPGRFARLEEKDLFALANLIQTPSYISFVTALSFYGLTTQLAPFIIESANPVRSKTYPVRSVTFRYLFCRSSLYFGFVRRDGVFIAEPEKALLDSLYFLSVGRYTLDRSALDLKNIRWSEIEKWLKKYPRRFREFYQKWRAYENPRTP